MARPLTPAIHRGEGSYGRAANGLERRDTGFQDQRHRHPRTMAKWMRCMRFPMSLWRRAAADATAADRSRRPVMARPAPTHEQNRRALRMAAESIATMLTGVIASHLSAYGQPMDGAEPVRRRTHRLLRGPGRRSVRCPFMLAPEFSGGNVRQPGGFARHLAPLTAVRASAGMAGRRQLPGCNATTSAMAAAWSVKHFTQAIPGCARPGLRVSTTGVFPIPVRAVLQPASIASP